MNVHNNFSVHRIVTLQEFFEHSTDHSLRRFFERVLTQPKMFVTVMRIGQITRITATYSWAEYVAYVRYFGLILAGLLPHPLATVEGQPSWMHAVTITKKFLTVTLGSLKNILSGRKERQLVADPTLGESMIKDFLAHRTSLTDLSPRASFGDLNGLLQKVTQLERNAV